MLPSEDWPSEDWPLLSWTLCEGDKNSHGQKRGQPGEGSCPPDTETAPQMSSHAKIPHVKLLYYILNNSTVNIGSILHPASLQYTDFKIKYKR